VGTGASFEVRLPAVAASEVARPEAAPAPATGPASRGVRILLVDDNDDARELTASLLEHLGYTVDAAGDGDGALELARAQLPDLAILDIGLPGMDGFELGRRLDELAAGKPLLRIALTGYGQQSARERSHGEGFQRHLVKPVAPNLLLSTIEELVAEGRSWQTG
jgi:CheY-like chemotaxis protein